MGARYAIRIRSAKERLDELSQRAQSQTIHSSELMERAKKALKRSREIMKRVQLRKTSWNPPGH